MVRGLLPNASESEVSASVGSAYESGCSNGNDAAIGLYERVVLGRLHHEVVGAAEIDGKASRTIRSERRI
jgi:hypothetical protein